MTHPARRGALLALAAFSAALSVPPAGAGPLIKPKARASYFPPAGEWAHKPPLQLGIDPVKLGEAVAYAQAHETERARDFSDQRQTFGEPLGSLPPKRAATNGVVIYKGYVVAEFGDTHFVDPT